LDAIVNQTTQTLGLQIVRLQLQKQIVELAAFRVLTESIISQGEVINAFALSLLVFIVNFYPRESRDLPRMYRGANARLLFGLP
jgi:hypothetical protein